MVHNIFGTQFFSYLYSMIQAAININIKRVSILIEYCGLADKISDVKKDKRKKEDSYDDTRFGRGI